MFKKDDSVNYETIINSFTKKDEPVFMELNEYLISIGLKAALICVIYRKVSCYASSNKNGNGHKTVPVLTIFAADSNGYDKFICEPARMGLIRDDVKAEIILRWKDLCAKYGYDIKQLYDNKMYVRLDNAQAFVTTYIIRNLKLKVASLVLGLAHVRPRYVYASSMPSYNIVFDNEADYSKSEKYFDIIKNEIQKMVAVKCRQYLGSTAENILKINYWHPSLKGYNGYGLARED